MEILPDAFKSYCEEKSAQSGFDPGGYAFCLLITAGNTIDHRAKLNLGPFKVPAFLWQIVVKKVLRKKSAKLSENRSRGELQPGPAESLKQKN